MGLMLLGVLAQVDAAVSVFAPPLEPAEAKGEEEEEMQRKSGREVLEATAIRDIGTAVSRETVMMAERGVPVARPENQADDSRHQRDRPLETVELASPKDADRPKTKKKKAFATGDEFDDIFGSLEKTSKRPKKRKRGNEFDDIFSGL
ncbi:hypothetical protein B0T16DRAFT_413273 [Cercophora newfieldiana]|uniref:Uncharacterized protein n=1 Tax=Cercophora newfieldiana TaxID=92897 RepID=A0AA39Y8C7_9PEZI|nr:hypothetical protein B0T16DRAFT_413273 [Cercophora newfieldiana]